MKNLFYDRHIDFLREYAPEQVKGYIIENRFLAGGVALLGIIGIPLVYHFSSQDKSEPELEPVSQNIRHIGDTLPEKNILLQKI